MKYLAFILFTLVAIAASQHLEFVQAQGGATTRVSVASDSTQANASSSDPFISADGRYVAFVSSASTLVSNDTNGVGDIFVHDRQTGQTSRVSIASNGAQGNGSASWPSTSDDGRYITFMSFASTLVSGDTNSVRDVFVHDRQTGQTARVSIASNGAQGNGASEFPSISANGRYVVFTSFASNLVSGDNNGTWDIFVHDRQTGQTNLLSVASNGTQGNQASGAPGISNDGRYVAFRSDASNLVTGDTNNAVDVFVHDRQTGQTSRASVASDSTQGNGDSLRPSISTNGRYVLFASDASNLIIGDTNADRDIFVRDLQTNQTSRISIASNGTEGNGLSDRPGISTDGRYVVFSSDASSLINDDTNSATDVFVHDRQTGQTTRISVAANGTQVSGNTVLDWSSISADGRYVAFVSSANNLVTGDTNGVDDVFVYDRLSPSSGALTFENHTGNPVTVKLLGYATLTFPGNLGPHLWSSIPPGIYDWEATGTCPGIGSGTVGSTQSGDNHRAPITIIANQTVLLNAEKGGKFTCGDELLTNLYIKNNTTGTISSYTIHNTPQGNITCSNIPAGATVLCGDFTPGTYNVSVNTTQCGSNSGTVNFQPGDVTRTVACGGLIGFRIFLPVALKMPAVLLTDLKVKNNTNGIVSYTVQNTPQGNIICSNIPAGATVFCGSFTPGTYKVSVSAPCGTSSGPLYFKEGDVTRTVSCE